MNQLRNGGRGLSLFGIWAVYALIWEMGGSMRLYGNAITPHGAKIEQLLLVMSVLGILCCGEDFVSWCTRVCACYSLLRRGLSMLVH